MSGGLLRVYFLDDAWTTIPAKSDTTAEELCKTICKKRNLHLQSANEYALYVIESNSEQTYERRLEGQEVPLEIQDTVKKHGRLENLKFVFKLNTQQADDEALKGGDGEEDIFGPGTKTPAQKPEEYSRCGYLEKRGKINSSWKERWFVLQGEKLFYFRDHEQKTAIAFISVGDAVIVESPHDRGNRGREFLFEINTKQRVFYLRARTHQDMVNWVHELCKQSSVQKENDILDDIQGWIEEIEQHNSEADEKRIEQFSTLKGLLTSPSGLDYFMHFVTENHAEENLLFWTLTEDYRRGTRTAAEVKKKGTDIYEQFVKTGADLEIACDEATRKSIKDLIATGDEKKLAFFHLQGRTFTLMEASTFPAFMNSKHYQQALLHVPVVLPKFFKDSQYRMALNDPRPYGGDPGTIAADLDPVDPKERKSQRILGTSSSAKDLTALEGSLSPLLHRAKTGDAPLDGTPEANEGVYLGGSSPENSWVSEGGATDGGNPEEDNLDDSMGSRPGLRRLRNSGGNNTGVITSPGQLSSGTNLTSISGTPNSGGISPRVGLTPPLRINNNRTGPKKDLTIHNSGSVSPTTPDSNSFKSPFSSPLGLGGGTGESKKWRQKKGIFEDSLPSPVHNKQGGGFAFDKDLKYENDAELNFLGGTSSSGNSQTGGGSGELGGIDPALEELVGGMYGEEEAMEELLRETPNVKKDKNKNPPPPYPEELDFA